MRIIFLAAVLMGILVLVQLFGCATPAAKASIPDDTILICYKGQYAICSKAAEECSLFKTECRPGTGVI